MNWQIRIPFRDRDESLLDVLNNTRQAFEGEDRSVMRQVVIDEMFGGTANSAGELIDAIERASPDERRQRLDRARTRAGLEPVAEYEAGQRFEAANRGLRPGRDAEGKALQRCHAEDCEAVPLDDSGLIVPVVDRRWFCAAHRRLAAPEDHLPEEPAWAIGAHFQPVPLGAEAERLRAEDAQRQAEHRQRSTERRAEAEAIEAARQRYAEQAPPVNVLGVRVGRGGRVVSE